MGFGGERQRLQLLGVRRREAVRSVHVIGVRGGWRCWGGKRCGGRGRGVQRGGGAGLRQVRVRQVRDGVRLRWLGAGLRRRGLVSAVAGRARPLQLRVHVLNRNWRGWGVADNGTVRAHQGSGFLSQPLCHSSVPSMYHECT